MSTIKLHGGHIFEANLIKYFTTGYLTLFDVTKNIFISRRVRQMLKLRPLLRRRFVKMIRSTSKISRKICIFEVDRDLKSNNYVRIDKAIRNK